MRKKSIDGKTVFRLSLIEMSFFWENESLYLNTVEYGEISENSISISFLYKWFFVEYIDNNTFSANVLFKVIFRKNHWKILNGLIWKCLHFTRKQQTLNIICILWKYTRNQQYESYYPIAPLSVLQEVRISLFP